MLTVPKVLLQPDSSSRLLLFAPHPDDETLAAGVLLQRAARAGAAIKVVYVTDGDNNPWAQRVVDRKWRLDAADRKRWGRFRRREALAALFALGIPSKTAHFLGLPDQGLTDLLLGAASRTAATFRNLIDEWCPTHIVLPALCDRHPDHNAVGVLVRLALSQMQRTMPVQLWTYLVHGHSETFFHSAAPLSQTEAEKLDKIRAIHFHRSQVTLSKRRFLGYAARPESFAPLQSIREPKGEGSLRSISQRDSTLCLRFDFRSRPRYPGNAGTILLVGHDRHGTPRSWRIPMPVQSRMVAIEECKSGAAVSTALFRTGYISGSMFIPASIFSSAESLFVKYHRRSWFFDREGWLEAPPSRAIETRQPSQRLDLPSADLVEAR